LNPHPVANLVSRRECPIADSGRSGTVTALRFDG
jgi:hypothetical protein